LGLSEGDKGATAVESGIMVGLTATVIVAAVIAIGRELQMFRDIVMDLGGILQNVRYLAEDFPWWVWLTLVGSLLLMWLFIRK
jgi:Flp pilus assembly pilin Flp